jgi:hypothetical protein
MVYRVPSVAPQSQVPPERRGPVMGYYCLVCASLYPLHRATHTGRPVYGRDHIASPCAHEGDVFAPGAAWWEPGVEVLPVAPAAAASAQPPAAPPGASAGPGAAAPPGASAAKP